jgi:hypothetical protein
MLLAGRSLTPSLYLPSLFAACTYQQTKDVKPSTDKSNGQSTSPTVDLRVKWSIDKATVPPLIGPR